MVISSFHILISLKLYFHLNIKDWKCGAVKTREGKNGKTYGTKLCQNGLRQCVLCQRDSPGNLWCPFDSVQKNKIHGMNYCALAYRVLLNIADWMPLRGSEWGGPLVGCRLKFSYFVGSRLNFLIFVGCQKISFNK